MSDELLFALFVIGSLLLVAFLVLAIVLAIRVWKTGKYLQTMGLGGKWVLWGAIIYTISPIDLLPDPIYLDDVGVLGGALIYLTRLAAKARQNQQRQGQVVPPPQQPQRRPPPQQPQRHPPQRMR
ncbi:YkvA family protein [Dactylosporangium sp. NPDC000555]|uniref:YkvA family protein n=1 Tax=Dactylosporangium sp. NPDC000555 TaxID=3154260 RepID=UPI0033278FD4